MKTQLKTFFAGLIFMLFSVLVAPSVLAEEEDTAKDSVYETTLEDSAYTLSDESTSTGDETLEVTILCR